jgi:hypothetical protein
MKKRHKFYVLLFCCVAVLLAVVSVLLLVSNNRKEETTLVEKEIITFSPNPTSSPTLTLKPTPYISITKAPSVILSKPLSLDELFEKYGLIYGVDKNVLKKIASCESGLDPNQVTGIYGGLFQFSDLSWTEARGRMGKSADQNLKFNAEESIKTAAFEINYKGTSGWSDCD